MSKEEKEIFDKVSTLPNNTITWEDTVYALYLNSKLEKSKESIKNGNVITLKELKKCIDGLEG